MFDRSDENLKNLFGTKTEKPQENVVITQTPTQHQEEAQPDVQTRQEEEKRQEAPIEAVKQPSQLEVFDKLAHTDTEKVLNAVTNQTALELIKTDANVALQVETQAKEQIGTHLEIQKIKTIQKKTEATFDTRKNACRVYGVEDSVPAWQQKLMAIGSGVWFVIYFIIASVTIAPISTFALKLNVIFKKTWIAIVVAVIVYLLIAVVTPVILATK